MDKQTAMILMQIVKLLTDIKSELEYIRKTSKKEAMQNIAESKTRERQVRKQIMLNEAKTRKNMI